MIGNFARALAARGSQPAAYATTNSDAAFRSPQSWFSAGCDAIIN